MAHFVVLALVASGFKNAFFYDNYCYINFILELCMSNLHAIATFHADYLSLCNPEAAV